jgi:hypothetical protein
VCVDSLEEAWLASGVFESSLGAGETPGAEDWIVTALGVVRFNTAQLAVQILSNAVQVRVSQGVGFLWTAGDTSGAKRTDNRPAGDADEGWSRMTGGTVVLAPSPPREPLEAARTAVKACTALGLSARDLATTLLRNGETGVGDREPGDGGTSHAAASIASRQVTTRRLARAACAVASLRVAALPISDAQANLAAQLREAAANWRTLPANY